MHKTKFDTHLQSRIIFVDLTGAWGHVPVLFLSLRMLYLEIGNSRIKLAERTPGGEFLVHWFDDPTALIGRIDPYTKVLVAPVAEGKAESLYQVLPSHIQLHILERKLFFDFIGDSYDTPSTLGLDRILNLYALEEDAIVISCGTAITVDLLHKGKPFWGGIMPGFSTASKGLSDYAPALPRVTYDDFKGLPARTSHESVANGVYLGIALGAQQLAHSLADSLGLTEDVPVLLTGGGADTLARLWKSEYAFSLRLSLLFEGMARKGIT